MTYVLTDRERQAIADCGWGICEVGEQNGKPFVDIENWSPLGEDLLETIWIESGETLASAARRVADYFDVDEHVEALIPMRGERGVPGSISDLVEDAKKIEKMLEDLATALEKAEELDRATPKWYRIPLVWQMFGHVWVEAKSEEEAVEYALGPAPLPDGEYVDCSVEVDEDIEIEVAECKKGDDADE